MYANNFQGITTYYLRYDLHFSNHKVTDSRLTMVPAEKDFRGENFSYFSVSSLVRIDHQESYHALENLAKKNAFTRLLEQNGLKSINAKDLDTVVSYEALVHTPIDLHIGLYDNTLGGYPYAARVNFAPMAFPDQWDDLRLKFKIKEIFNDFILFFK